MQVVKALLIYIAGAMLVLLVVLALALLYAALRPARAGEVACVDRGLTGYALGQCQSGERRDHAIGFDDSDWSRPTPSARPRRLRHAPPAHVPSASPSYEDLEADVDALRREVDDLETELELGQ